MSRNPDTSVRRITISCFFLLALLATSCSASTTAVQIDNASSADANADPSVQVDGSESVESTDETANAANAPDPAEDTAPTPEPDPTATPVPEIADVPALPLANGVAIEQLTARSGGGTRPVLAWNPVAAADSYSVVVYDAQGAAWWSWAGDDTQVVVGGVDTEANIGGPRADTGVRWSVFAFDTEGNLVGASPKRSLEP